MPSHVVGEVRHHNCSLSSLFNVFAGDFDEIKVPVNVHLACGVVHYLSCWVDLAVCFVEVEESLEVIVIRSQFIRLFQL